MEIGITGATGFVGVNLINEIKDFHDIKPMSVRFIPNQQITIHSDAIIHLAGKAHDLKKVSTPSDYYEANYELTKQLYDAFLLSKASIFIFVSSVKAVADTVEGILTEEDVPNPKTHYGISKLKAEQYILSKEIPQGKRIYILRPCMIHGPGNKGNLNLLYKLVSKSIPWPLGSFNNKRSFLSIDNFSFIVNELLSNNEIPSGIYNVSDNNALSSNELIRLLGVSLGKRSLVWNINTYIVKLFAKFGDYLNLPLNSERLSKLTENYIVSNDKVVKAIGKALPLRSDKGLIITFNSFSKNKI